MCQKQEKVMYDCNWRLREIKTSICWADVQFWEAVSFLLTWASHPTSRIKDDINWTHRMLPQFPEPYSKSWYIQENNDTPKTRCNILNLTNQPTNQPSNDSSHSSPSTKETENFMNFSSVAPSTGCSEPSWTLPARVSCTGCSPSGRSYCGVGPLHGHESCQQPWFSVGSSLHGFTGHAQSLLLPT